MQGAVTRLVAQVERSDEPLDFGAPYLWRVANHAVIDEIRRRTPRREESMPEAEVASDGPDDPERRLSGQRIREGVADCLEEAAEDRRAALNLYLQGLKVPEIARALGWDRKRAENLVYRGLTDLRACLEMKGLRP